MKLKSDTEKRIWADAFMKVCPLRTDNPVTIERSEEAADRLIALIRKRAEIPDAEEGGPNEMFQLLICKDANSAGPEVRTRGGRWWPAEPGTTLRGMRFEGWAYAQDMGPEDMRECQDWFEREVMPRMVPTSREEQRESVDG